MRVLPYDPAWPERFEALRARAWAAVSGVALRIEHVGSTSVPGLAAKPVIDMDVVVAGQADLEPAIQALAGIGYHHRGDLGIQGRHAFTRPEGLPAHNLYVCWEGSLGLRNHLALRDLLRAHPEQARAYGALKLELAERFAQDSGAYTQGKTQWIVERLEALGLGGAELEEIRRSNQAGVSTRSSGTR